MSSTDLYLESNIPFSGLLSLVKNDLIFFRIFFMSSFFSGVPIYLGDFINFNQ